MCMVMPIAEEIASRLRSVDDRDVLETYYRAVAEELASKTLMPDEAVWAWHNAAIDNVTVLAGGLTITDLTENWEAHMRAVFADDPGFAQAAVDYLPELNRAFADDF